MLLTIPQWKSVWKLWKMFTMRKCNVIRGLFGDVIKGGFYECLLLLSNLYLLIHILAFLLFSHRILVCVCVWILHVEIPLCNIHFRCNPDGLTLHMLSISVCVQSLLDACLRGFVLFSPIHPPPLVSFCSPWSCCELPPWGLSQIESDGRLSRMWTALS